MNFFLNSLKKPAIVAWGVLLFCNLLTAQAPRPNIIHIIADDVGYDDLGCYGAKDIRTPHLDKMASEGLRLTQFYAPYSTCTPSRAALLTGRVTPRVNNHKGLNVLWPTDTIGLDADAEVCVAKILKKQGYRTALIGKWHLGHLPKFLPPRHGFDVYCGIPYPNDHGPERRGGTGSAGYPPIPLMEGSDKVQDCSNSDLAELPRMFRWRTGRFLQQAAKEGGPFYLQISNIETHTPWFLPSGFGGTSQAADFGDAVEYLDETVGILLEQLRTLKLDKNTIVIFTSDNGPVRSPSVENERNYGRFARYDTSRTAYLLRGGKGQSRYEGGIKVPAIVWQPGVTPAGTVSDQLISGCDLFTTFVGLAGGTVPVDRPIDGKDLQGLFQNPAQAPVLRHWFFGFQYDGLLMSVRYKNWKLALPGRGGWRMAPLEKPELYDLSVDPSEKQNIAEKHPDLVIQMSAVAEQARKAVAIDQPLPDPILKGY
jgi:arylsulfatase A